MILLGNGRTAADVADALLIDPETVRTYLKRFKKGGLDELLRMNYAGGEALLDAVQLAELDAHLQEQLHLTAESFVSLVTTNDQTHPRRRSACRRLTALTGVGCSALLATPAETVLC